MHQVPTAAATARAALPQLVRRKSRCLQVCSLPAVPGSCPGFTCWETSLPVLLQSVTLRAGTHHVEGAAAAVPAELPAPSVLVPAFELFCHGDTGVSLGYCCAGTLSSTRLPAPQVQPRKREKDLQGNCMNYLSQSQKSTRICSKPNVLPHVYCCSPVSTSFLFATSALRPQPGSRPTCLQSRARKSKRGRANTSKYVHF